MSQSLLNRPMALKAATCIAAAILGSSNANAADAPKAASPRADWQRVCEGTPSVCHRFVVGRADIYEGYKDAPPAPVLLFKTVGREATISALVTEAQHKKVWTNKQPVEWERAGVRYVPDRSFFHPNRPVELAVDDKPVVTLRVLDEAHVQAVLDDAVIDELKRGKSAELRFAHALMGNGQKVVFSLKGFDVEAVPVKPAAAADRNPVYVVMDNLAPKTGFTGSLLERKRNPWGEGAFVYAQFEAGGLKQKPLWFVKDGYLMAVNGEARRLTPTAVNPLDVGFEVWKGSGLTTDDIVKRGISLAFE